ncbi:MAG: helicase HerA-like domain-containing protein [Hyphomicrobiaceae bacterium]
MQFQTKTSAGGTASSADGAGFDQMSLAFEHSITWEDDIWNADPVDVELVHDRARRKFADVLEAVAGNASGARTAAAQARILLFHGQSGAGKTHLVRALRTSAHRQGKAYFGYAQMTPDVGNYADYFLRRLINALDKPYDPDQGGESALQRLTRHLVSDAEVLDPKALEMLREADLDEKALARLVLELADTVVASPKFGGQDLDINIVRALLYMQRNDPRIDQRVRTYLYGRELTGMSHEAVAALDPNKGDGRAFEIIESIGKLMWTVDRAAFVFAIDQVEDLRFFADYQERFQKAVRDLIQIANRLPSSIVIISVLGDFYDKVREVLAQSYIDRIEKAGPVQLVETRNAEEARLIIERRLQHAAASGLDFGTTDPMAHFGPGFFEEFTGLSTRRLLELAQTKFRDDGRVEAVATADTPGFLNALVQALGGSFAAPPPAPKAVDNGVDFREVWERFSSDSQVEIPQDDHGMLSVLQSALQLARNEWGGTLDITIEKLTIADDLPAIDMSLKHRSGFATDSRIFLCNRSLQGGAFKRQLDRALSSMSTKSCFMLRASDYPPNTKSQTALAFRRFRESGGRALLIPLAEWERIMTVRDFHSQHQTLPGFKDWFEQAKLLSGLVAIVQLLRLDLLNRNLAKVDGASKANMAAVVAAASDAFKLGGLATIGAPSVEPVTYAQVAHAPVPPALGLPAATGMNYIPTPAADWTGWAPTPLDAAASSPSPQGDSDKKEDDLPLAVILDENGADHGSILAGCMLKTNKAVTLNKNVLKRHAAVLGGSGSGKTTLALCLIEQVLQRGIPAILIDRKGDLCSYANPDVWRAIEGDYSDRRGEREKLADQIDVAVYTPGRSSGRPISITLLPTGIKELPEHEQTLLANLSSAALGDMLHLKNSATHQKQSGTLSVALKLLGQRFSTQVMLADLIHLLEEDDPELAEATQRMDPSGKLRRDLVAQLDSLRHRNASLFEAGGETLNMERLLGLGPFARSDGRTRLSIIYTGFLGDNENILFWVAQFLSEALRFCQRNPNDELQAILMLDEADLYIPATAKPATAEPLQSLLKRARSAGLGIMLATQSPGDLDYKSRDQITSWFIGRVREDTALKKLKAAFQSDSGLDAASVLPGQTVGEFHLVQEGLVRAIKAHRSLIQAEQVPFDRIEQLARETKGQDEKQLRLFS